MAQISYKEICSLSLEDVAKELPLQYKQLTLSKAEVGKQKGATFIVGTLTEMHKRRIESRKSGPILRLKLQEVLESGLGSNFEAIVYGENVKALSERLQDNSQQKIKISTWILFVNVTVIKYTGMAEPWLPFSLKVIDEDHEDTREQKIFIFRQSTKSSKRITKLQYASINEVKDKSRSNLFVVVKEVIKHTAVLNNNNKHTMLSVVDPSCLPTANRTELHVHIFFNDPKDHLPDPIMHGDILRLRELLGDFYAKEKKMFGKVLSSNAIVKFRLKEKADVIIPYTSNQTYEITDQDRKIVQDLRRWWEKNCDCHEDLAAPTVETDSTLKKLCDIEKPSIFTLRCQVKKVRNVPSLKIVAFRVEDGTAPKVYVSEVNFDEATVDYASQEAQYIDHIKTFKLKELDITVLPELYEQGLKVKEGDFVELVNLTGENITQGTRKTKAFDFCLKTGSEIIVLHPSMCKAKRLASAIKESKTEPETTSEESRETDSREGEPLNSTRSLDITPCAADSPGMEDEGSNAEERPCQRDQTNGLKETYHKNRSLEREGIDSNNAAEEDRPDRKCLRSRNDSGPPAAKKKLCSVVTSTCNDAVNRKVTSYIWQEQEVNTECNIYRKSSLTEFFSSSKGGDKCRVWALLKHIHYTTKEKCKNCQSLNCYHDWVWGLCVKCGNIVSSADIRQHFSKKTLLTEASLPCPSCPSPSSGQEPTLHPFIKLEFCLEEVYDDNTYSVDLSGDMARLFFGVEPSFKWIVGPISALLQERTNIYKQLNQIRPFQFCLVNRFTPDGRNSFHICDTALKL